MQKPSKCHLFKRIYYDFTTDAKYNLRDSMRISIIAFVICFLISLFAIYMHYVRIIKLAVFAVIFILGYMTIHKTYHRLDKDWNTATPKIRDNIYSLLLKMIGLYSIFILGTINFNPTKNPLNGWLSAFYISFIILAELISISVTNNEIEHYLPKTQSTKNSLKLYIPSHKITDVKGHKLKIKKYSINAKILKK